MEFLFVSNEMIVYFDRYLDVNYRCKSNIFMISKRSSKSLLLSSVLRTVQSLSFSMTVGSEKFLQKAVRHVLYGVISKKPTAPSPFP